MNRRLRTEILVEQTYEILADLIVPIEEKYDIQLLEEPHNGLVMVKMRESGQKKLYYIGEVFVTESKVMINGVMGLGILRGAHKKRAYALAVIDAIFNGEFSESKEIEKILVQINEALQQRKEKERIQLLKTKVDFETLNEEVKA